MSESRTGLRAIAEEKPRRRRRFSVETANDLLFWSAQLSLVAISLGIMWIKVDGTTTAMKRVIAAQEKELRLAEKGALAEAAAAQEARNAEHTRSIQLQAAVGSLNTVLAQVSEIQADIKKTLAAASQTNQLVLEASQATKDAAIQAEKQANNAAGAAGGAANAAARAAAVSGHTANTVATKVVMSTDKKELEAQQRTLARKEAQLTRAIKTVKKKGPTLMQQIFH